MSVWEEIVDYVVPSNTTSVTLNNFGTITKDDFIKIVGSYKSSASNALYVNLHVNNDTNNSNYYYQELQALDSSVASNRNNFSYIGVTVNGLTTVVNTYIKISENNKVNYFSSGNFDTGSNVRTQFEYTTSVSNHSDIQSLTFNSGSSSGGTQTNGISAGSRIQIYKLNAEKVADVVVNSNTTQVDITGLNITKDSEYLLVSDIDINASSTQSNYLFANNDTTLTNYYYQRITGNGNLDNADRGNEPRLNSVSANSSVLSYSHIKLSNIGAFTAQSYGIRNYGSSSIIITNSFLSSTSESITSINELNIKSNDSNGIGTGSRFHLYKLY